jgi:PAS domain S-box-containing protein
MLEIDNSGGPGGPAAASPKPAPTYPVRVLILEDSASDAELMVRELRRNGFDPAWERVDTEAAYVQQLATAPDIVLADFRLPQLDAPRALDLLHGLGLNIPFIVVSGAIGEDVAVSMMRNGASDYLLKDRLARLGPAVKRAIEDQRLFEDKRKAAAALESSEIRFHSFMNNSPALAFIKDEDGRMLYLNNTCERMWGVRRAECIGKFDRELWPLRTAETLRAHDEEVLRDGRPSRLVEDVLLRDGRCLQLLSFRFVMHDATGRRMLGGVSVDIGEQLRTQKALSKALRAKETLLREVHHRVKNNLQVISSLVNMQAASLKDPAAVRAFDDIQKRVRAMALIHERLRGDDDLDRLDFGEYAGMLAHDLFYSYSIDSERIGLKLELESVSLELNQAVPCGLILNELLTNSLKYAFPNGRPGEIRVAVARGPNDVVKLTVSDNGIGLPPGFNWAQSQSLGLQIIDTLAHQLDGTATHEPAAGATFTISFQATAPSYFGPRTQPE